MKKIRNIFKITFQFCVFIVYHFFSLKLAETIEENVGNFENSLMQRLDEPFQSFPRVFTKGHTDSKH